MSEPTEPIAALAAIAALLILEHAESAVARAGRAGGGHLAYASGAIVVRLEDASLGTGPQSGATLQKSA